MKDITPEILFDIVLKDCFLDSTSDREQEVINIFEEYLEHIESMNNTIVNPMVLIEKFLKRQILMVQVHFNNFSILHSQY